MSLKRRREGPPAEFQPVIDHSSPPSVARQLYLCLRDAMTSGQLSGGQRMPSTRLASKEWKLSRGTISEAYEMLISEGYAVARQGSGTFISQSVSQDLNGPDHPREPAVEEAGRGLSRAVTAILNSGLSLEPQRALPFVTGRIAQDDRTASLLRRIAGRHRNYSFEGYGDIQGDLDLRTVIAEHLAASRAVRCTPDQLFITAGTQQALDLAFRVLASPGDTAVVEDPCYPPARQCLVLNGVKVVGLAVDQDGLRMDGLRTGEVAPPRVFYVTPSNQYPTGSVLSLSRRMQLLSYARENGCWIVEDDYDSEFRYSGSPLASLQGLDRQNRVVYTGSFSKALLPGLRIGYLVVPPDLVPIFRAIRPALDRCPASFQQRIVADFLGEGHFPAHLRRLRERLRASRDLLHRYLDERTRDHLIVVLPDQGVNLSVMSAGTWQDDVALSAAAKKQGVVVAPFSRMSMAPLERSRLLLGFSGLSEEEADMGTRRLARAFERRL